MTPFHLKIVTADGVFFDGQAEQLNVRTSTGDIGIMARHMNYLAPLGMGHAVVIVDGKRRSAACMGGMVSVMNGEVILVPTTFEWAEDIDLERAERSLTNAQQSLEDAAKHDDIVAADVAAKAARAKITRAMVRRGVARYHLDLNPGELRK